MKRIQILIIALGLIMTQFVATAGLPVKRVLTLDVAKKIAAAAEAEANKRGSTVVIVVVDDGGHILLLERLRGSVGVAGSDAPARRDSNYP